jgi:hypothetical protein
MCVPYSEIRSTVLSRRPVNSASLSHRRGRESTFRGGEILGNAGGREPQHPWGGEPGRRASRRRFLHNITCNSISANYELARSCP